MFLKENLTDNIKNVVITSDSTVSQNRNQYVTCMMLLIVQILPNLETLEVKYLEPGHMEMEVDSMHSSIDSCGKNLKVSSPYEWSVILQNARRQQP